MKDSQITDSLKHALSQKRPVFGEVLSSYGGMTLFEYAEHINRASVSNNSSKKSECIQALCAEAALFFNPVELLSIRNQLEKSYIVSTAEHHGPLVHPFFLNSNLLLATQSVENIISLAVGNVSLNNSSYPRGVLLHDREGNERRYSFFKSYERHMSVFQSGSVEDSTFQNIKNLIERQLPDTKTKVEYLFNTIYNNEKNKFSFYSQQVTYTNKMLWENFFPAGDFHPRFVNLQIEDVVLRLIVEYHMQANTEIHKLLFDADVLSRFCDLFNGIQGAFNRQSHTGTCLFWAIVPQEHKKEPLSVSGKFLISASGYRVELKPERLLAAIKRRELIPSTALSLLVLSCYYGLECMGGFSQGTYLTEIQKAYNELFHDSQLTQTKSFMSDMYVAYAQCGNRVVPATGIDLCLYGDGSSWDTFKALARTITLEEALAPLFPELYKMLYKEYEQDKKLVSLQGCDMFSLYKLQDKIRPCIKI